MTLKPNSTHQICDDNANAITYMHVHLDSAGFSRNGKTVSKMATIFPTSLRTEFLIKWAAAWENQQSAYAKTKAQMSSNCEADQRLCFRYMDSISLYFLNPKFPASSHLLSFKCTARVMSDMVGTQIVGFLTHRLKYNPQTMTVLKIELEKCK